MTKENRAVVLVVLQEATMVPPALDWNASKAWILQTLMRDWASSHMTLVTRQEKVYQPPFSDETLKLGQGEEFPLVAEQPHTARAVDG